MLWGRHDPYIPVTNAELQRAAFPHAEIRVLERSGHWPFVDDSATVTAALTGFLARHAGRELTEPEAPVHAPTLAGHTFPLPSA